MNNTGYPGQKGKTDVDEEVGATAPIEQHCKGRNEKAENVKAHSALKVVRSRILEHEGVAYSR